MSDYTRNLQNEKYQEFTGGQSSIWADGWAKPAISGGEAVEQFDSRFTDLQEAALQQDKKFKVELGWLGLSARGPNRMSWSTGASPIIRLKITPAASGFPGGGKGALIPMPEEAKPPHLSNSEYVASMRSLSSKPRAVRGSKGMSQLEKNNIRDGCAIHEEVPSGCQAFLTVTLPCSDEESLRVAHVHWTPMMKALTQQIRQQVRRKLDEGFEFRYVGVPELQKRGALHEHIEFPYDDERIREFIANNLQGWWHRILTTYSKKTGVDLFKRYNGKTWARKPHLLRAECEKVRESVGVYMSKYLRKGSMIDRDPAIPKPRSWMIMDKWTRADVKARKRTEPRSSECIHELEAILENMRTIFSDDAIRILPMRNPFSGRLIGYTFITTMELHKAVYEHGVALLREGKGRDLMDNLWVRETDPDDNCGIESAA